MKPSNYYSSNKDMAFHLEKRVDYGKIFELTSEEEHEAFSAKTPEEYKQNCLEILQAFGAICAEKIAPNARKVDEGSLELKDNKVIFSEVLQENLGTLQEFGMSALSVHPRYGGMGGPFLMEMAGCEMLNRACPSTMLNCAWYAPIARIIMAYGSQELIDQYVGSIVAGEISGNMALTEADAGSDLGAIRTHATKIEGENLYLLNGEKKFITNGSSELSLVLARGINKKKGLAGLSLYLCPKEFDGQTNYTIGSLEKKVALNGSATCELVYQDSKAYLLGEEGHGYRYMLDLMNDSRIGVGFQALGLLEGIYQDTLAYASERASWGKNILSHELIAEKMLDQRANLTAVRSLAYKVAYYRSIVHLIEDKLKFGNPDEREKESLEKEKKELSHKIRFYTPLIKYKISEDSVKYAREGVQILGGYGFTKEYSAEWHLREALIYTIYEGTSQMQALMSMKDTIKQVIKDPQNTFSDLVSRTYRTYTDKDPLQRKFQKMIQIERKAVIRILTRLVSVNMKSKLSEESSFDWMRVVQFLKENLSDFSILSPALVNAERLCEIKAHIACCRSLLEDLEYDRERKHLTERFINKSYLKINALYEEISYKEPVLDYLLMNGSKQVEDSLFF